MNPQTSAGEDEEKGEPFALLVGMQTSTATVESSVEIPQKIKNGFVFWPSDPTAWNISGGTQNTDLKKHEHPCVHCSVIYNHEDVEAAQCPSVDEWVKKQVIYDSYIQWDNTKPLKRMNFLL